jgi:hypothetical protein
VRRIIAANKDTSTAYWTGLNEYAAMSPEEFRKLMLSPMKPPIRTPPRNGATRTRLQGRRLLQTLPTYKNWAAEGKVTPVKNQLQVGGRAHISFRAAGGMHGGRYRQEHAVVTDLVASLSSGHLRHRRICPPSLALQRWCLCTQPVRKQDRGTPLFSTTFKLTTCWLPHPFCAVRKLLGVCGSGCHRVQGAHCPQPQRHRVQHRPVRAADGRHACLHWLVI